MQHFDLFKTLCSRFVIDFWRENSNFFFEWKVSKQVMYFHIDLVLNRGALIPFDDFALIFAID